MTTQPTTLSEAVQIQAQEVTQSGRIIGHYLKLGAGRYVVWTPSGTDVRVRATHQTCLDWLSAEALTTTQPTTLSAATRIVAQMNARDRTTFTPETWRESVGTLLALGDGTDQLDEEAVLEAMIPLVVVTLADVIEQRVALFRAGNDAGEGFAPDKDLGRCVYAATTTSEPSVYQLGRTVTLVGTVHGLWAVRVHDVA